MANVADDMESLSRVGQAMRRPPLPSQPASFLAEMAGASRWVDRDTAAREMVVVEKRAAEQHRNAKTDAERLGIDATAARDRARIQRELAHDQTERAERQRPVS